MLADLRRDVLHALRLLRRHPAFSQSSMGRWRQRHKCRDGGLQPCRLAAVAPAAGNERNGLGRYGRVAHAGGPPAGLSALNLDAAVMLRITVIDLQ